MTWSLLLSSQLLFGTCTIVNGFGYQEPDGVPFSVQQFGPYFNYEGNLNVSGYVRGTTVGTTHIFEYELQGVDPLCVSGAGDMANSCGIHFHEGTDCESDAGAHYFSSILDEDPWASISYTAVESVGQYIAAGESVAVETGFEAIDIVGHAFIVHAYDGSRVACGLIEDY